MDAQTPSAETAAAELPAREAMEFDVVIVGAGPAGLAAAIRLKQITPEISVVVVEKGSEVGAHILSGAVIDPIGLDRLLPEWRSEDSPIKTQSIRRPLLLAVVIRRLAAAEFHDAAADEQSRQLHRLARRGLPLAGDESRSGRRRNLSGLRGGGSFVRRQRRGAGIATGDMGIGKDGKPKASFTRGMELRAKYTLFAEGARGNLTKMLLNAIRAWRGTRAAEIRHRPERALAGRAGKASAGAGAAFIRLAARQQHRRRLVSLSLRRQSRFGRLRGASQLRESLSLAVRGIPALQDASAHPRHLRGRQAALLRRARADRRRLSVGAEAEFPRRRADRLRRRLHERAAHQGQPQRHAVRHARGGACRARRWRPDAATTNSPVTKKPGARPRSAAISGRCATSNRCGRNSALFAGIALGGLDMWTNTLGFSLFGTLRHGKPDYASLKPAAECSRSFIRSRTAS